MEGVKAQKSRRERIGKEFKFVRCAVGIRGYPIRSMNCQDGPTYSSRYSETMGRAREY